MPPIITVKSGSPSAPAATSVPPEPSPDTNGHAASPLDAMRFHGLVLPAPRSGSSQINVECPWCGKEKFFVHATTGQWDCKVCGESGNGYGFLRTLWKRSMEATTEADYRELAESRKLADWRTPRAWGCCRSILSGLWLVPGHGLDGKLNQLYRWTPAPKDGKPNAHALLATAGHSHALIGVPLRDARKRGAYLCEGPWDAMALWELLRVVKRDDEGRLLRTGNESLSLIAEANVLAVPGATTFREKWGEAMAGDWLALMFDSDHPREANGKLVEGAGIVGMRKAAQRLATAEAKPKEIRYLEWGVDGFDPNRPSGTDVRDVLSSGDPRTLGDRIPNLDALLARVQPIPDSWLEGSEAKAATARKKGRVEIEPIACESWTALQGQWRRAMQWGEGLDRCLSVMLASLASTNSVGDQLWIMVLSPPSCLDGDTPIYDPVDGSTVSVREREQKGLPFHVYSRTEKGDVIVNPAEPPRRFPVSNMFRITTKSGRSIRVTGGHRIWTTEGYVSIDTMLHGRREISSYRLPTISELDLSVHGQDVLRSTRTVGGSRVGCPAYSCSDGGRPLQGQDTAQASAPSRVDVQEHIHDGSGRGDLVVSDTHNPPVEQPDLLSNSSDHRSSRISDGASSPPSSGDFQQQCVDPHLSLGRSQISPCRIRTTVVSLPSGVLTEARLEAQHSRVSGSEGSRTWSPRESGDTPQPNGPGHTSQESERSSQAGIGLENRVLALWLDGASPPPDEDTSGQPLNQHPSSDKPRQGSIPNGRGERPLHVERRSTEQPSDSLQIRVGNEVMDVPILPEFDVIESILSDGADVYYDFHVPGTENYWACGLFHHNTGKSTLCEALSANTRHVVAKSTMRGFHSGYQTDRDATEDYSLISKLNGKTLITKDGDTLLQADDLGRILSEARDVYDRVSRTSYRNSASRDYVGISMTWILCGTSALRQLDTSELGERFLKCIIMEGVDAEVERSIIRKILYRQRDVKGTPIAEAEALSDPDTAKAVRMTSGYVDYLGRWGNALLQKIEDTDEHMEQIADLAQFVAILRARPSKRQMETVDREMGGRLASQLHRLATCLAVVLQRTTLDAEVMRRTVRCAMDTARGRTLEIARVLSRCGAEGMPLRTIALLTNQSEGSERTLLKFLRDLKVVELIETKIAGVQQRRANWRLTADFAALFGRVMALAGESGG